MLTQNHVVTERPDWCLQTESSLLCILADMLRTTTITMLHHSLFRLTCYRIVLYHKIFCLSHRKSSNRSHYMPTFDQFILSYLLCRVLSLVSVIVVYLILYTYFQRMLWYKNYGWFCRENKWHGRIFLFQTGSIQQRFLKRTVKAGQMSKLLTAFNKPFWFTKQYIYWVYQNLKSGVITKILYFYKRQNNLSFRLKIATSF